MTSSSSRLTYKSTSTILSPNYIDPTLTAAFLVDWISLILYLILFLLTYSILISSKVSPFIIMKTHDWGTGQLWY